MTNVFLRSLKGCELTFERNGSTMLIRESSKQGSSKYELPEIPEVYQIFFADVPEFFEQLRIVAQDNLQLNDSKLLYTMATATKTIKLVLPLKKLTLSQVEQLHTLNLSLKNELAKVQNSLDEKCVENKTLQEQIYALQKRIADLEIKGEKTAKCGVVFEEEKDSSPNERSEMVPEEEKSIDCAKNAGKANLKRTAPELCWPQSQGGSKKGKLQSEAEKVLPIDKFAFQPDPTHPNFQYFQWQQGQLKHIGSNIGLYRNITSAEALSQSGRIAIEWRIIKESFNSVLFGLLKECDRIKESKDVDHCVQLSLKSERLFLRGIDGSSEEVMSGVKAGEKIKLVVNMEAEMLSLLRNSSVVHSREMRGGLKGTKWHVFVSMSSKGELIEFP